MNSKLGFMSSSPQIQKPEPLGPPRVVKRRLKVGIACLSCRHRKIKCDAKREYLKQSCTYPTRPVDAPATSAHQSRDTKPQDVIVREISDERNGIYHGSSPSIFAGEVKAAIDARLGLPGNERLGPLPMSDAPLFGLLAHRRSSNHNLPNLDNVLPPRRHADYLMDIYWRYIQPLEPLVDQDHFSQSYQALYAGDSSNEDERIFLSSLNTVFALSTQLQETLQPAQREEASNTYFNRAWILLRPETIIWEPGSLEVVQCLLLMSRYLQCTNNPHQTWMAVGSAVRVAQSLDLHLPEKLSSDPHGRRKQQLWQCCMFMERQISWVLGQSPMTSLYISPILINTQEEKGLDAQDGELSASYFSKSLEVYEIANQVILSQSVSSSTLEDKLGLPRHNTKDEFWGTIVRFDGYLNKWEKNLPIPLRLDAYASKTESVAYRRATMLHLRYLHARIHLFRPMLARFCLSQSQPASLLLGLSLEARLLRECSPLCIESAQEVIKIVHEHQKPDGSIGILPWWHRVFYLHVASTILVASMLRNDLFTLSVSQSWNQAMSAFHAHEHLSPFVQQCTITFQTLASKISGAQSSNVNGPMALPEWPSNTYFQDMFQDIGFDPDSSQFGKEDMNWLSNFDSIL